MRNQTLALVEPTDIVKKLIGWPDECGRNPSVLGWKWSLMLVAARTNPASARTKAPRTTGESAGNDHKYSPERPTNSPDSPREVAHRAREKCLKRAPMGRQALTNVRGGHPQPSRAARHCV